MSNEQRPIYEIVREIRSIWATIGKGEYFGATPYLDALSTPDITDEHSPYMFETAGDMVPYLLSNMRSFRGPDARRLKTELKQHSRWTRK